MGQTLKRHLPSFGAFAGIYSPRQTDWSREIIWVRSLPGVQHVELWMEYFSFTPSQLRWFRNALRGLDIILHAPFANSSLVTHKDRIVRATLEDLKQTARIGRFLGARVMTIHPGSYLPAFSESEIMAQFLQMYRKLSIATRPVVVSVENPPGEAGSTGKFPAELRTIRALARRAPKLPFTLDTGHAMKNGQSVTELLKLLRGRIADIHLHDYNPRSRDHLPLGQGQLNLDAFFRTLVRTQYAGYVSLETYPPEPRSWHILQRYAKKYYPHDD